LPRAFTIFLFPPNVLPPLARKDGTPNSDDGENWEGNADDAKSDEDGSTTVTTYCESRYVTLTSVWRDVSDLVRTL
jgi:hypothetical protein